MKRLIKFCNCKGFTLVETILAVFILFVVSTMLINGFIAAIAYSYQTSVYSKSGSKNYDICMQDVADWNELTKSDREAEGYSYSSTKKTSLVFSARGVHTEAKKFKDLGVAFEKKDDLSGTVPLELNFADGRFAPAEDEDQLSDNRTIFKYYPKYCWDGTRTTTIGSIVVAYNKATHKYVWTVYEERNDDTKWKVAIN